MIDEKRSLDFLKSLTDEQKIELCELIRDDEKRFDDSTKEYFKIINVYSLHGLVTSDVYNLYVYFCIMNKLTAISKIEFSRRVVKTFPVHIIDKKINGKKRRVFIADAWVMML